MKINISISLFFVVLMGFLISCDNETDVQVLDESITRVESLEPIEYLNISYMGNTFPCFNNKMSSFRFFFAPVGQYNSTI